MNKMVQTYHYLPYGTGVIVFNGTYHDASPVFVRITDMDDGTVKISDCGFVRNKLMGKYKDSLIEKMESYNQQAGYGDSSSSIRIVEKDALSVEVEKLFSHVTSMYSHIENEIDGEASMLHKPLVPSVDLNQHFFPLYESYAVEFEFSDSSSDFSIALNEYYPTEKPYTELRQEKLKVTRVGDTLSYFIDGEAVSEEEYGAHIPFFKSRKKQYMRDSIDRFSLIRSFVMLADTRK